MVLKIHTSSQLQRDAHTVFNSAKKKAVEIRRQGDIDYILLTKQDYEKLVRSCEK